MKYNQLALCLLAVVSVCSCNPKASDKVQETPVPEVETLSTELENSVLWKIEHESLEEPSYLFGTVHILCKSDDFIPQKVVNALNEVDELILEIDFADPTEIGMMQKMMTEITPISEQVSEEEFAKLDEKIQDIVGIPLKALDQMGFIGLTSLLATKSLDCQEQASLEMELIQLAMQNEQNVDGLETVEEQFTILMDAFTVEESVEAIYEFDKGKEALQKAVEIYLTTEDIDEVVDILMKSDEKMSEKTEDELLIKRNNNWIEIIPDSIAEESALIAVGTAHLVDEYGVIYQLRKLGYTVTPVY